MIDNNNTPSDDGGGSKSEFPGANASEGPRDMIKKGPVRDRDRSRLTK